MTPRSAGVRILQGLLTPPVPRCVAYSGNRQIARLRDGAWEDFCFAVFSKDLWSFPLCGELGTCVLSGVSSSHTCFKCLLKSYYIRARSQQAVTR